MINKIKNNSIEKQTITTDKLKIKCCICDKIIGMGLLGKEITVKSLDATSISEISQDNHFRFKIYCPECSLTNLIF